MTDAPPPVDAAARPPGWLDDVRRVVARRAGWIGAALGLGWFLWLRGGPVIAPTRVEWMMREDWAAHLFGWLFFRNADWQLPLTAAPNHLYPYGTSVAFTDGNPWLAVLLKPVSPLLPADFQYTGAWLALCFVLMGWFGAQLVGEATDRALPRILGGALFAMAPPMTARFSHPTLCAHWMLVALIWLNVRAYPSARGARRALALAAALAIVAAGVHVYWVAMILPLTVALCVRLAWERRIGAPALAAYLVAVAAADVALFALFGFFGGGSGLGAEGFGAFSADLLSLVSPMGWSKLVPNVPVGPRQGEGFGFLGAGALALLPIAAVSAAIRFRTVSAVPWRRGVPLAVAVTAFALFALSSRVTFAGRPVLNLEALYAPLSAITSAFRSSGRFVWPLTYSLIALAVLLLVRIWRDERRLVATVALAAAVALQAYDVPAERSPLGRPGQIRRLANPSWDLLAREGYAHLALHPPQVQWVCRYDEPLVNALAYKAYRLGLTFNSGYASRTPAALEQECRALLPRDGVDERTAYVVTPDRLPAFRNAGARCGSIDGLTVCVHASRDDAFARAVLSRPAERGLR